MKEQEGLEPEGLDPAIDPSVWRGLTQPRMSRRQLLASAGAGAGALGLSAFLTACGVKGASSSRASSTPAAGGVGSAAWWSKQPLHHTGNLPNWPYYIHM